MKVPFYKYQGAGNDFIILDQRDQKYLAKTDVQKIRIFCDRRFGVGADGLMFLERSNLSDFVMVYFNADGNESTMCGNGGRCIVKLAYELDIIGVDNCSFEASDGLHEALILDGGSVSLKMKDVDKISQTDLNYIVDTGSPHLVIIEKELNQIDVVKRAKKIRYSDQFIEEGINVNFIQITGDSIHIRTYERGVEDETLACGTGVTAAALVAAHISMEKNSLSYDVNTQGGKLSVSLVKNDQGFENIWLTGPAEFVFQGTYRL